MRDKKKGKMTTVFTKQLSKNTRVRDVQKTNRDMLYIFNNGLRLAKT